MEVILSEFQGVAPSISPQVWGTAGDVKYHLGTTKTMKINGKDVTITVLPNPSHLEQVDPMLMGRVRAEQDFIGDKDRSKVLGICIHGDAAFAGQGVVYESMQMTELKNFCTGGVLHFIVNNQIGYTTAPRDSRTSVYCTELAKSVGAPIIHVNGEDPDAVVRASEFAAEYRQKFHKDVVVDLIAYRLYGHNELDQPKFTNPVMYNVIEKMKTFYGKQKDWMAQNKLISEAQINESYNAIWKRYESALDQSKKIKNDWKEWVALGSTVMKKPEEVGGFGKTGLPKKFLTELGMKISNLPEGWIFHPQIVKIFQGRVQSLKDGKGLDWATGEQLAWATLLHEGYNVRISGQDVQRGTFSHRHAYLHHQKEDKYFVPLREVSKVNGTSFVAANSHLSELGVLGFEYAYSMARPNTLTMWEGQFGDFANGAQVMIDQLVTSGEVKWGVQTGLTMLLPHGYDGQGAEHSSARLERYLQLSDDDPMNVPIFSKALKRVNIQVINCTTSANIFHAFRRQMKRDFRKPLIAMTPKRLLRLREAGSNIEEFDEGSDFKVTYDEQSTNLVQPSYIKKLILCCGQVYYDLVKARDDAKINVYS
jgi:2-oxoglutarate dehydrogenase E1 component